MKAAVVIDWLLAGFMGLFVPFAPLVATAISRDPSYLRDYRRTVLRGAGHLKGQVRSRAFSRYVLYGRQQPVGETVVGECTHCGNCCMHRQCIFLDWSSSGQSRCRIYNTAFWKRLACGRYPETGVDIGLYGCPSFTTVPSTERVRRRVIPVVAAPQQEAMQRQSMQ
ncbi:MAG: hypothetical protein ABI794_12730 [Betaproteobacteria bacterium]